MQEATICPTCICICFCTYIVFVFVLYLNNNCSNQQVMLGTRQEATTHQLQHDPSLLLLRLPPHQVDNNPACLIVRSFIVFSPSSHSYFSN